MTNHPHNQTKGMPTGHDVHPFLRAQLVDTLVTTAATGSSATTFPSVCARLVDADYSNSETLPDRRSFPLIVSNSGLISSAYLLFDLSRSRFASAQA